MGVYENGCHVRIPSDSPGYTFKDESDKEDRMQWCKNQKHPSNGKQEILSYKSIIRNNWEITSLIIRHDKIFFT